MSQVVMVAVTTADQMMKAKLVGTKLGFLKHSVVKSTSDVSGIGIPFQ